MKFLNLGCGYPRIKGDEWTNLDNLHAHLLEGTPEREGLDRETNYVNFDVLSGALPFDTDTFDGVLACHFFEHFDAQQGLAIMRECKRVLKIGGVLLVSVPDAAYFQRVHGQDRKENWPQLFDVSDPNNGYASFFEAALWFNEHKAMLTAPALWAYFTMAGFKIIWNLQDTPQEMVAHLNRRIFSAEMAGQKT